MSKLLKEEISLQSLIGEVYDASLDSSVWSSVQNKICDLTGGVGSHIVLFDRQHTPLETLIFSKLGNSFAQSMEDDYFNWYHQFDDQRVQKVISNGPGIVVTQEELTPASVRKTCPIYNEYFKEYDSQTQLIYGASVGSKHAVTFCQARSRSSKGYTDKQKALYKNLSDHLTHSIAMREKVVEMFGQNHQLHELVAGERNNVIVLNKQRKILWANESAKHLFSTSDNLYIGNGALRVSNAQDQEGIDKLINQALLLGSQDKERCGFTAVHHMGSPLVLTVFSTSLDTAFFSDNQPVAVLVFHDPKNSIAPPVELVQSFFGLTPAEAKIAQGLTRGLSVKEYGIESGLKESTIRSTLKLVREKTNCRTQSELVKAIINLVN